MNYNYPQAQYPNQQAGYGGYNRPMPQYPPQWTPAANVNQQVRPVSSIEEVRACPIDFDGSVFYFTDVANHRIYTKQINLDGTVSINLYELKTDQFADSSAQYVTKQEFENAIKAIYLKYEELVRPVENPVQIAAQPPIQQQQLTKPTFDF